MSKARSLKPRDFGKRFSFESFGVPVCLESDQQSLLDKAAELVGTAFGNKASIVPDAAAGIEHRFGLAAENGQFTLYRNGFKVDSGPSERNFFSYLNSMLRLEVAEYAEGNVFVHAGVVGWKGSAIVLPGISFSGKSTLTAELVRSGAEYYSDEYAVLDKNGNVGPFPRLLSIRPEDGSGEKTVSAEDLGGVRGTASIPVGMVLFTQFLSDGKWNPEVLPPGTGIMELIPNTLTMRRDPAFSLKVLDLVAQRAIMVKSLRGDAREFAKFLLDFFDNKSKLAKMT